MVQVIVGHDLSQFFTVAYFSVVQLQANLLPAKHVGQLLLNGPAEDV
jgi:hypothetical protein